MIRGDHIAHFLIFIPIPFLIHGTLRSSELKIIYILIISLLFGSFFELTHLFLNYRAFTSADLIANLLGCVLGVFFLHLFLKYKRKSYRG